MSNILTTRTPLVWLLLLMTSLSLCFLNCNSISQKPVAILSIDGGGVRGIIPGVILAFVESKIQEFSNDKSARIADYFDFVAGTSTGGLITAMITTPGPNNRPLYAADQIVGFYFNESKYIFPQPFSQPQIQMSDNLETRNSGWDPLLSPFYDGKYLHALIKNILGSKRLSQALTNVVIPSFDIKSFKPIIFSSAKAKKYYKVNVKMSDACISTSAAPVYLPPYYFASRGRAYNMIDGGVAANNPSLLAVCEAIGVKGADFGNFLVLSLGTGREKEGFEVGGNGEDWGGLKWLLKVDGIHVTHPLMDVVMGGPEEMAHLYTSILFEATGNRKNYLRVQAYNLSIKDSAMDKSSDEHLNALKKIGENLLAQHKKEISEFVKNVVTLKKQGGQGLASY